MRIVLPETWRAQPWRNGAGTTYELVREPAEPAPFDVRISVAAIERPAPFSAFPGYRRALYLVDGGPVTLAVAGERITLAHPGDELRFAGDADVAATEVAAASRDLNFMVRDGIAWRSSAVRTSVRLAAQRVAVFVLAPPVSLAVVRRASPRSAGTALPLHACAWCDGDADVTVGDGGLAVTLSLGSG